MHKRFMIWASSVLLSLFFALPASAEGILTGDAAILDLFFPNCPIEARNDFYYALPVGPDGVGVGPADSTAYYKVRESKSIGDKFLIVLEGYGKAHWSGYRNFSFGVYDPSVGSLVGEPMHLSADEADYALYYRDGVPYVLSIGSKTNQGLQSFSGGLWAWEGANWVQRWPAGDASDFWVGRKGVIDWTQISYGVVHFFKVAPGGSDLADYTWEEDTTEVLFPN